jgi:hypothetical protein
LNESGKNSFLLRHGKHDRRYLVWEIEENASELQIMTFAYHSTVLQLFILGTNPSIPSWHLLSLQNAK